MRLPVDTEVPVQAGQIHRRRGRLARIGRHQLPQLLGAQDLQQIQPRELVAPVAAQVQRHHQRPAHGIFRLPVAGPGAQQQELRRGSLSGPRMEDRNALAVGLQGFLHGRRQRRILAPRRAMNVESTHQLVQLQRGRAQSLRQPPLHQTAVELQLPATLLRMDKAQGPPDILRRLGADMRDFRVVAPDPHAALKPFEDQLAIQARLGPHAIDRQRGPCQQNQSAGRSRQMPCAPEPRIGRRFCRRSDVSHIASCHASGAQHPHADRVQPWATIPVWAMAQC